MTYTIFSFLGIGNKGDITGLALLVSVCYFIHLVYIIYLASLLVTCTQGGTFLYVATVLQPVKHHSPVPGEMRATTRVFIIILGMFTPLVFRLFHHAH